MNGPRGLMIAAPRSGSGKTVLTLGLMRALRDKGFRVGAAKCGPDYIDPAFHAAAAGRAGVNLDSWAMPPELLRALADAGAAGGDGPADFTLCEASMGLFDAVPGPPGRTGASADVAAALGWPAILCLDVSGQAQSAGAVALGCARFDPRLQFAGVIFNRVASERHLRLAKAGVEAAGLRLLGALPREKDIVLPERHLGLVQAQEIEGLETRLGRIARFVGAHCDLDAIATLAAAGAAPAAAAPPIAVAPPAQRIALARDDAFSFVYPHVLSGWRAAGAQVRFFSPLADEPPPADCDLVWLPGGYPELHAGKIAAAGRFLDGLRRFAAAKPVHGECGGYMILGESLTDASGEAHAMAGLLSARFSFARRRLNLGYREARLCADHPLGPAGTRLRGHEFHYATASDEDADAPFAQGRDAHGGAPARAGAQRGAVSGSFFHLIAKD
ncbi:cobyrinate a,c-diamide synthase [Methylocella sp.]|uniref:cobyrinate a,c-diamide synthase n=1 Tax=Methylocella sp. TaxID=1978226 RepID=UPI0037830BF7